LQAHSSEGWLASSAYTVTNVAIRTGTVESWERLSIEMKHRLVAFCRVQDTMQAWENHLQAEKLKGK